MRDGPASALTVRMAPHKDDSTTNRLLKTSKEQNSTYVKTLNSFPMPYATDSDIAMTAFEKVYGYITLMRASVKLTGVLRSKISVQENAHSKERTTRVFIVRLPASIQGAVKMFWDCDKNCGSPRDCPVHRSVSGTDQTSATLRDGSRSKYFVSERSLYDSHRSGSCQVRVHIS